tara:strand:- start:5512 stop:6444 length:933 start_codon:yes stop_codon:yes gene_type:complete
MKNYLVIIFCIFFLNSANSEISNKIVLKVGSQIITSNQIRNKILSTLILSNVEINQKNINSLKKSSLENLIQIKLKKIELIKYNMDLDTQTNLKVNNYLRSISSNNVDELRNKFKYNNLNFKYFIDEIKTEINWQNLIYKIYSNRINIDENIVENEIENLIEGKSKSEEFNLSEIEILEISNDLVATNELILDTQEQIEMNGFEVTAARLSISTTSIDKGLIGWVNSKSLSKSIYDEIKNLQIDQISKPIKRQNSILFLKINDKRELSYNATDKSKIEKKIINQKKNELLNLYSKNHLSKIRNNILIEYK